MNRAVEPKMGVTAWWPIGLAAIAGGWILWVAMQEGRVLTSTVGTHPAQEVIGVQIPRVEQENITDWAEFFACYNLVQDDSVIIATLRENSFGPDVAWRPDREIRLVLRPSATSEGPTPSEQKVLEEVRRIRNAPSAGAHPCKS